MRLVIRLKDTELDDRQEVIRANEVHEADAWIFWNNLDTAEKEIRLYRVVHESLGCCS
jgi:hypothetical protein